MQTRKAGARSILTEAKLANEIELTESLSRCHQFLGNIQNLMALYEDSVKVVHRQGHLKGLHSTKQRGPQLGA